MTSHADLRIAELLASRLCHDLVSPIGAVNNGMELMEEDPEPEFAEDAIRLASNSARQASAVVQFYRMAYGRAGYEVDRDVAQLRGLAEAYAAPLKTAVALNAEDLGRTSAVGGGKLLLNMVALGIEALPRGGHVDAEARSGTGTLSLAVTATGEGARVRAETRAALSDGADVDDLTPRTVHGFFTRRLAIDAGGRFDVVEGEGLVRVSVTLPEV